MPELLRELQAHKLERDGFGEKLKIREKQKNKKNKKTAIGEIRMTLYN